MRPSRFALASIMAGAVLLAPSTVSAQDEQAPPPPRVDTELVLEREVFQYPSFTRRNPFRPLVGADGGGPRFEQMSLIGLMYSTEPSASVAVLSTGGVAIAEDGTQSPIAGDSWNLKVGDTIGNTTIVEIRRDAVIVDVEVFDATERHTMTFVSRPEGGTP
jgi:hypothetical protein